MSAIIRGRIMSGLLGLTAAASLLACGDVETPEALTLKAFHGLSATTDGCVHSDLPSAKGFFDARLSAGGLGDFAIYLLLENNLISNQDLSIGRLDTNGVTVESYEISFDRAEPWGFLPATYTIKTGSVISTSESLYAPIAAIPQAVAQLILENNDIFASGPVDLRFSAKAKGKLFDGAAASSNELSYTVTVCNDCFRPCGGGPVEAMCSAGAQPDGYKCAKTSGGQ